MTNEYRYFLESNCVGVNRLIDFIQIMMNMLKYLMLENIFTKRHNKKL